MNKRALLKELNVETYVRLGVSTICPGVGVFAIKDIPEGVDPFKKCREIVKWVRLSVDDLNTLPASVRELVSDMCVREKGKYYIPDFGINQNDASFYLNHGKNSNMKPERLGKTFIAKRLILAGEELLVNYDEYDEGEHNY